MIQEKMRIKKLCLCGGLDTTLLIFAFTLLWLQVFFGCYVVLLKDSSFGVYWEGELIFD